MTHIARLMAVVAIAAVVPAMAMAQQSQPRPAQAQPAQPAPAAPQAQGQPAIDQPVAIKIAVIDIEGIHRRATSMRDMRAQVDQYKKDFAAEARKEDEALRKANQELARQRTILAPEAFAEEQRKFEVRYGEAQNFVQTFRAEVDKSERAAVAEMQKVLDQALEEIIKEFDITMVFRREHMVFVVPQLDLTELVLRRVDKVLPTVKVAAPGTTLGGPAPAAAKPATGAAKPPANTAAQPKK